MIAYSISRSRKGLSMSNSESKRFLHLNKEFRGPADANQQTLRAQLCFLQGICVFGDF